MVSYEDKIKALIKLRVEFVARDNEIIILDSSTITDTQLLEALEAGEETPTPDPITILEMKVQELQLIIDTMLQGVE